MHFAFSLNLGVWIREFMELGSEVLGVRET